MSVLAAGDGVDAGAADEVVPLAGAVEASLLDELAVSDEDPPDPAESLFPSPLEVDGLALP